MTQRLIGAKLRRDPRYMNLQERAELERQQRVAAYMEWRDREHKFAMLDGQCVYCWGWVDDPRHWGQEELFIVTGRTGARRWAGQARLPLASHFPGSGGS